MLKRCGLNPEDFIETEDLVENEIWYAYIEKEPSGNGWFNNQCYVDILSEKAISKFFDVSVDYLLE